MKFYSELKNTIETLKNDFVSIPPERKVALQELSGFVLDRSSKGLSAALIFICTHNSRRSHIAQIWAQTAAAFYGVKNVVAFSGGTEVTAFNSRAVDALQSVGFRIDTFTDGENPIYHVHFGQDAPRIEVYSKKYDSISAGESFAAIMTCSHADRNCPIVYGMEKRISLPYDDPKDFDGTDFEKEKYLERVKEIGKEILYAFSNMSSDSR